MKCIHDTIVVIAKSIGIDIVNKLVVICSDDDVSMVGNRIGLV